MTPLPGINDLQTLVATLEKATIFTTADQQSKLGSFIY